MKVKKKQITCTLNVTPVDSSRNFNSMQVALKRFTKKKGALGKNSPSLDTCQTFSALLCRLNIFLARIHLVLSTKQSRSDLRVQMHLLSPWVPHFDRLLCNVLRILNDRVAMLWRPKRSEDFVSLLHDAVILHQDVNSYELILKNAVKVFNGDIPPMIMSSPQFESSNERSTFFRVDGQLSVIAKNIILKMLCLLNKHLPGIILRIECYVNSRLQDKVTAILANTMDAERRMYCSKESGRNQLDLITFIDESVVSLMVTSLRDTKCTVTPMRLLSVSLNSCCDAILAYILNKRFKFNEMGVLRLYSQLQELLMCAAKAKGQLEFLSCTNIAHGQFSWMRANEILQLLLNAVTGGKATKETLCSNPAQFHCTCLSISEQDSYASLARYPSKCCLCLPSLSRKKCGVVSISPVLLTENI